MVHQLKLVLIVYTYPLPFEPLSTPHPTLLGNHRGPGWETWRLKPDKVEKPVRGSRPQALSQEGWWVEEKPGNSTDTQTAEKERLVRQSKEEGRPTAWTGLTWKAVKTNYSRKTVTAGSNVTGGSKETSLVQSTDYFPSVFCETD